MKLQLLYFRFIFAILYLSSVSADAQVSQNVSVNQNVKYQTIQGWGVSLAWWANLAGGMPQSTIDELAGYAVNDLNLNVFRFNIGGGENPNCTAGDHIRKDGAKMPGYRSQQADGQGWGTYDLTSDVRQISMMDKIAMLRQNKGDIITETISYSPPWWMTYGECSAGNVSATSENLKPEFIDDFADYLVSVTAGLKAAHPLWNISYIEPFNEPMSGYWMKGGLQEGSGIYPATQAQILYRLWQSQSTYNMWSISLGAADNSKVPTTLSNMTTLKTNNPNEYNFLAKINTHSYDGTWQEKVNLSSFAKTNGNKPIWQTETGPLSWNLPSGKTDWQIRHYDMAYRLIEDLRNLQSVVWCDWQLLSSDDGWGLIQQTNWNENNPYQTPVLKKTRGFYCRKNVTNYIKAGYQIIDINNGSSLAALSPDKSEAVMVMVNNSDTTKSYTIDLSSFGYLSGFKTYRTSGFISGTGEDCTEKTVSSATEKGLLSGNTLSYTAPAYSVTTFVVSLLALAPVPNGDYFIKAVHSNKYMTVAGFSSTNGAVIEQYDYSNQDNLKFTVTRDLNGYYKFKPKYTDKIMTVNGGSNSNGTAININTEDTNASNQKFIIEDLGSGQYRVTPKYSLNKALGVSGQGELNGDDVVLWDYLDAGNFKWEFIPVSAVNSIPNGDYNIKAVHSNKYMTVAGFSSTNGAVIEQYDYSNQDNLKFTVTRDLNGYYKFKPKYTDKIMTVNGGSNSNGTAININTEDTNASNQKFIIEDLGSGQYRVTPKYSLNKALGVSDQGQLNGDDVVLWDYLDAGNFKWEFIPVNAVNSMPNGDYNIKAVHSNKYMSVAGFSSTNGAVIEQYDYSNQDNLKFTVTRDLNGYYKFKPKYTDKIMTVNGGSNSNGTAININNEDTNASNQKFIIEDLGSGQYRVTPKYSLNKALGVSNQGQLNGDDVVLWDYLDAGNFKWEFIPVSAVNSIPNGDYNIKAVHSNKYMSVAGFSSTNGAVIEQYDYSNQDNLKFTVTRDLNGYYKFKPKYTDKIMTVNGGSNSNGTAININTEDTNASNQKFIIEDLGSGQYRVTPKYSLNKALGVSDQGQLNGDDVVLWDYLGTDNFKWTFTSTSSNLKVKNGNDKQILFEDSTLENKNNFNNIKIYPNPSGGLFKISKEGSVPLNLQIFDITGKLLTETVLIKLESELHLDKPLFNQGVYILKFSNERGAFISKIIVK